MPAKATLVAISWFNYFRKMSAVGCPLICFSSFIWLSWGKKKAFKVLILPTDCFFKLSYFYFVKYFQDRKCVSILHCFNSALLFTSYCCSHLLFVFTPTIVKKTSKAEITFHYPLCPELSKCCFQNDACCTLPCFLLQKHSMAPLALERRGCLQTWQQGRSAEDCSAQPW